MIEKKELNQTEKKSIFDNTVEDLLPALIWPEPKLPKSFYKGLKYWQKEFERYEKKRLEKERILEALLQKRKLNKLRKKTQALRHYRKKLIKLNKRKAS